MKVYTTLDPRHNFCEMNSAKWETGQIFRFSCMLSWILLSAAFGDWNLSRKIHIIRKNIDTHTHTQHSVPQVLQHHICIHRWHVCLWQSPPQIIRIKLAGHIW